MHCRTFVTFAGLYAAFLSAAARKTLLTSAN